MEVGDVVELAQTVTRIEDIRAKEGKLPDFPMEGKGRVRDEDDIAELTVRKRALSHVRDAVAKRRRDRRVPQLPRQVMEKRRVRPQHEIRHVRYEQMRIVEGCL